MGGENDVLYLLQPPISFGKVISLGKNVLFFSSRLLLPRFCEDLDATDVSVLSMFVCTKCFPATAKSQCW